jgi:hypothetical protein
MQEKGPIYGVELIDVLPANYGEPMGMQQAMPSRSDLRGIRDYRQGHRVVAGYEVLLNYWREQGKEITRLRDELLEYVEDAFQQLAHRCPEGDPMFGWWDSMSMSTTRALGDKLVELGAWERDPDGVGRRWFYRPIEKAEAKEE